MSDSFRFDPDAVLDPRERRRKHRKTRDARKAEYLTPSRVARVTRDASSRGVVSPSGRSD